MDDAELVGGVKRARDLLDDQRVLEDLVAREPGARDFRRRAGRLAGCERGARLEVHRARRRDAARRLACDPPREALAFDVAHRDVWDPALDPGVVDRADSGMIEPRRDLGLAAEALERLLRRGSGLAEDLQRDLALEPRVLGEIDGRLSAPADLVDDGIVPDLLQRVLRALMIGTRARCFGKLPADQRRRRS